jgi:hypothetical protein
MSLTRFRRSSRVIAAVLLLAAARLPHVAVDDAACVPAAIPGYGEHDESQHGFQANVPAGSEHCAVCHWTRSLRSPRAVLTLAVAEVAPPVIVHRIAEAEVVSAFLEDLPARAPPSSLL